MLSLIVTSSRSETTIEKKRDGVDIIECVIDVIITVLVDSPVSTADSYVSHVIATAAGTYDSTSPCST